MPNKGPLDDIACHFVERKWMRAAKAWRCFIQLPEHPLLASMLTGLIEDKVEIRIKGSIGLTIAPAFVVDVPSKGKRFSLVFETCYEHQATLGPKLTALTDTAIILTIDKFTAEAAVPKINRDPLSEQEIRGLHVGFFRNERFWDYLERLGAGAIHSPEEAKTAFKRHMGVESCKDLTRDKFIPFIQQFNSSLRSGDEH